MKINFNDHLKTFKDIKLGEVFRTENETYMRVNTIIGYDDLTYNAVCLDDGVMNSFDDDEMVDYCPNPQLTLG